MATIDELHAQSVSGDIDMLKKALIKALRTGAEFISPPADGPGAAAVAGIRSMLPGRGNFSQEFDRYNRAASPSPLLSGPEKFGSVVYSPDDPTKGAMDPESGGAQRAQAMALQSAMVAALKGPRLTEKRRDILFDRKGPANEPIRPIEDWESRPAGILAAQGNRDGEGGGVAQALREFERAGEGANPGSLQNIEALQGNLSAYGAGESAHGVLLAPRQARRSSERAITGLEAAIREGLDELPVRVYGSSYPVGQRGTDGGRRAPVPVPGTAGRSSREARRTTAFADRHSKHGPSRAEEAALDGKKVRIGYPRGLLHRGARSGNWPNRKFSDIAGRASGQ